RLFCLIAFPFFGGGGGLGLGKRFGPPPPKAPPPGGPGPLLPVLAQGGLDSPAGPGDLGRGRRAQGTVVFVPMIGRRTAFTAVLRMALPRYQPAAPSQPREGVRGACPLLPSECIFNRRSGAIPTA